MAALQKRNYAFKAGAVLTSAPVTILVLHMNFVVIAIEDGIFYFGSKFLPGCIK